MTIAELFPASYCHPNILLETKFLWHYFQKTCTTIWIYAIFNSTSFLFISFDLIVCISEWPCRNSMLSNCHSNHPSGPLTLLWWLRNSIDYRNVFGFAAMHFASKNSTLPSLAYWNFCKAALSLGMDSNSMWAASKTILWLGCKKGLVGLVPNLQVSYLRWSRYIKISIDHP